MKRVVVISSAPLVTKDKHYFLYSPYEKEMQLWAKHSDSIQFCCPVWEEDRNLLIAPLSFPTEKPVLLKEFEITSVLNVIKTIPLVFVNSYLIYKAMAQADHIHLRCPGNMGLLGAIVQTAFPSKQKTAKYAGNWDPKSPQPWSYRLQKWLLSNTFLTRNMQVLVYGEWPKQSKNIKPFFTATYSEKEIQTIPILLQKNLSLRAESRSSSNYKFIFVGTLSKGKQPLYAIQLVEILNNLGKKATLDLYGEGVLREELTNYMTTHSLQDTVVLKGNQDKETIKDAYQNSHFLILPSKSEGWPKAVAEAMFWGCVPIATPVSCVPNMVANGTRGLLLTESLEKDVRLINQLLAEPEHYLLKSKAAQEWSQHYTTDLFEREIKKLLAM